ncbi:MAG: acylphosphatase [Acidobacteriota bacterium]
MFDSPLRAVRWIVSGTVQGVSYRYFTQQAARDLELTGWVRNLADGTVEVQVAGDSEVIERFRAQLLQGPRFARVDDIAEEPADTDRLVRSLGHRGFDIHW